ncbi:MAG: hypothetical protein EXR36_00405 [Betaproteobacteria bacterium]|nr:hypothetical protein [Betaproteobacteria bacterium]
MAGLLSASPAQAQLTEARVEQFLVQLELAAERRDIAHIIDSLADDVVIVFRMAALGGMPDMTLDKVQYRDFLVGAFATIEAHGSRRYGTKITVSPDGMYAEVFANVEETTTMKGRTSVHTSQQTVLVALANNKLQVKRVFAEVMPGGSDT